MSSCSELDKPPTRGNMGVVQIIELIAMGVIAILCGYDFIYMLDWDYWNFFTILAMCVDVLVIVGLVLILVGLFGASGGLRKIQVGIYCFFGAAVLDVIIIVYFLLNYGGKASTWLINLLKAIILIFIAYILWRQSKNL